MSIVVSPLDLPDSDSHPPPEFHPLLPGLLILNGVNMLLTIIYSYFMLRVIAPGTPAGLQLTQTQHLMLIGWCLLLFVLAGYTVTRCIRVVLGGNVTERIVAPFFTLLSLPALTLSPMALVHVLTL